MFGMSPLATALVVAVAAFIVTGWWFGVHRRRLAETAAGVAALAGMKWRECAGLVLQALGEKGYREAPSSRQPGDGGTEFLLVKGEERCLLSYKHGTAYRLGEANVRDFANAVQLQGATSGILVTLGTAEGFARDLARRYGVDLIYGRGLWPQVEPFAPPALVTSVRKHASGQIRRGQRMGLIGSLALGLLAFLGASAMQAPSDDAVATPARATPAGGEATPTPAATAPAPATPSPSTPAASTPDTSSAAAPSSAADQATIDATEALRELEQIALLSDEQRNQRRATAATRIAELPQVDTAAWSSPSTLAIRMLETDGVDDALVASACAVLADYEEIRYSRLQLEAPADDASAAPVRWRVCQ